MGYKRQDENAVVYAVNQVCGLYGVSVLREQSRTFTVPGAAGRSRPMFIGQWTDAKGEAHYSGKADLLARPQVKLDALIAVRIQRSMEITVSTPSGILLGDLKATVPLWIETKSKGNKLTADQEAFRYYVTQNGEFHIVISDDVRPLIEWFEAMGVKK